AFRPRCALRIANHQARGANLAILLRRNIAIGALVLALEGTADRAEVDGAAAHRDGHRQVVELADVMDVGEAPGLRPSRRSEAPELPTERREGFAEPRGGAGVAEPQRERRGNPPL